jgi:hypothetical protein
MKKIVLLMTIMMTLAGCTDLAEDSTDSEVLTAQDLDGLYMSVMFGLEVEMNSDDTFVISELDVYDCYETKVDADAGAAEILDDEMFAEEYDEATVVVSDNCVYIKTSLGSDDDGTTFATTLITQAAVPYIEMVVTSTDFEGEFTCDDGETIPADWVNDGEEDCDGGEDEGENAGDSLESESMEIATVYLAADGHGSLVYAEGVMEEDSTFCLPLGPSSVMPIFYQTGDLLDNLSDEELEGLEWDDESTYPTQLSDLISTVNQNYADSSIPGLTDSLCGGFTSMMATWLAWGGNLAEANTDSDFLLYDFSVYSAGTTFSTATGEAIVYVSLDTGDDLSWSTVNVQMKADGGVYVECTNPDKTSAAGCAVSDNDDGKWAFGEEVTISEGSDDICDGTGTCEVQVRIIDRRTNNLIYESNTINA